MAVSGVGGMGCVFLVPVLSKHAIASVIVLCATQKDKAVVIVMEL